MGGQTSTTPQLGASPMGSMPQMPAIGGQMGGNMPLASMFGTYQGYQPNQTQMPQIQAPQYPTATWTPQQAQAQTVAQMNALRPYVPPPAAPAAKPGDPWVHGGGANR